MSKLPMNVISFAKDNTEVYEQMKDYYFNYMSEAEIGGRGDQDLKSRLRRSHFLFKGVLEQRE